jgi:chemotaxis protein MotB
VSGAATRRRHRGGHDEHEGEHEEGERWLVSFADMMTLLFALFMVLFSISSVNVSKLQVLQKVLQDAFSGKILSGGSAVMESGSDKKAEKAAPEPPMPALSPLASLATESTSTSPDDSRKQAAAEQQDFQALKRRIDALARQHGLAGKVSTEVRRRGLVVQLLTDKLFFASGQATLQPGAVKLLDPLAKVVAGEREHPVIVEGHTDSQPVHSAQYPSNWELSGDRAAAVVRVLIHGGVLEKRLSLAGFAAEVPAATNSTAAGRAHNRRVDVVLSRIHPEP